MAYGNKILIKVHGESIIFLLIGMEKHQGVKIKKGSCIDA
jgi:hypothetical protein